MCTDAGGLFPLVYSEKLDALASTTTAMELVAKQRQSEASGELLDILRLIGWIPFGLTTFEGVRRLLPNFYLDISSSVPVRFYAPDGIINPDTSASVNGVLDRLRANIGAIIRGNAGFVHLTGGWDSRMVLAAARPWASECVFETVAGRGTELDCHLAAGLASKYGLKHELLPFVSPRQEEMEDWQYRVGYCLTDAVSRLGPTARAYDRNYHCINGVCGEVARAYYWARGYSGTEKIQPDELLERLGIPESPLMLREADNWLSSLGERRPTQILDVAYIEQRLGCWAGPSVFGHKVAYPTLSPFNSRAIYRLALALPEDARINNRFARALVLQAWPELLRIPINRAEGISKLRFAKQELKYFARAIGAKELVTTMKGWKTRRLKLFRPVS
ncbi:hypothetical protein MNKW57_20520 [Biformimicrobium ophioploci]|uniref:Asparagine synthetase domain-containing protein n=1 Tax=Biformimicrobium ophioploci TaxID=3036711 RepID=A0ABQ6M057_9GAMM|nr:hypothetical protein MNKW57_20520 [Microbulbifer sp. NKW57]